MNVTSQYSWLSSPILLSEAALVAACLVSTFAVSIFLNFTERRRQPFGRIKLFLPVLGGVALAIVLSVGKYNPAWMFIGNLLIGAAAGVIAWRLAPSKNLLKPLWRRRSKPNFPPVLEAGPATIAKLPEKTRRISFYRPEFDETRPGRPRMENGPQSRASR